MKINIYKPLAVQELGKRDNQEDCVYPSVGSATSGDSLFILCDGMGGHEHGEVASQTVCKCVSDYFRRHVMSVESFDDGMLMSALMSAYEELARYANKSGSRQMGTTLALLYFNAKGCVAAHIGDSRIYHLRPSTGNILYKSRDHSLVYDLYQAGEITYDEIKSFPQRNVITRAIMAGENRLVRPDIIHITNIKPGDYFYICSDGMMEQMDDDELLRVFASDNSDEVKRQILVDETSDNKDNHSAYIIHVSDVSMDIVDSNLADEEPTAKCNAMNIFPKEKVTTTDVKVVATGVKAKRRVHNNYLFVAIVCIVSLFIFGFVRCMNIRNGKVGKEKTEIIKNNKHHVIRHGK